MHLQAFMHIYHSRDLQRVRKDQETETRWLLRTKLIQTQKLNCQYNSQTLNYTTIVARRYSKLASDSQIFAAQVAVRMFRGHGNPNMNSIVNWVWGCCFTFYTTRLKAERAHVVCPTQVWWCFYSSECDVPTHHGWSSKLEIHFRCKLTNSVQIHNPTDLPKITLHWKFTWCTLLVSRSSSVK